MLSSIQPPLGSSSTRYLLLRSSSWLVGLDPSWYITAASPPVSKCSLWITGLGASSLGWVSVCEMVWGGCRKGELQAETLKWRAGEASAESWVHLEWWGDRKQVFKDRAALPYLCNPEEALEVMTFGPRRELPKSSTAPWAQQESCPAVGESRGQLGEGILLLNAEAQGKKAIILLNQSGKSKTMVMRGAEMLRGGRKTVTQPDKRNSFTSLCSQHSASPQKAAKPKTTEGMVRVASPIALLHRVLSAASSL